MSDIPAMFVFTDVEKANAEVARLHRACALSGNAILALLDLVPDCDFGEAKTIAEDLSRKLDAISDERGRT